MKPVVSFILIALGLISIIVLTIIGDIPYWSYYIPSGVSLVAMATLLAGIILPTRTVSRGMELIKSQDYNNRLVSVGEPNSDKIVSLFNSLIDKLRSERLMNREQESLLTLLIDASPMGVIMLDYNYYITLYNSSFLKMCGIIGSENLKGRKINEIQNDIIVDMLKVPLGKSEVIRKGNYRIYRCYHLNFIKEGFKREFYLLESLTEEIRKAEKASYEKVIRTISHEVNNSMGGVRAVLEIMSDTNDNPEIGKVIESCEIRCERMCDFIRDYADVVKLPNPLRKKLNLAKEIELIRPFLLQMIPERINLQFSSCENPYIFADATQIQQVILNIVKNAVESIWSQGEISINIREVADGVELDISNNGIPISEVESSQLFTPFFTTKPDGKGIGLTFVREVLNRHNADFRLFTDNNGITRFNILFK